MLVADRLVGAVEVAWLVVLSSELRLLLLLLGAATLVSLVPRWLLLLAEPMDTLLLLLWGLVPLGGLLLRESRGANLARDGLPLFAGLLLRV